MVLRFGPWILAALLGLLAFGLWQHGRYQAQRVTTVEQQRDEATRDKRRAEQEVRDVAATNRELADRLQHLTEVDAEHQRELGKVRADYERAARTIAGLQDEHDCLDAPVPDAIRRMFGPPESGASGGAPAGDATGTEPIGTP